MQNWKNCLLAFQPFAHIVYVVPNDLNDALFLYCNRTRKRISVTIFESGSYLNVLFFTFASNNGRMMVEKFNKYEAFKLNMNNEQNKNIKFIHHFVASAILLFAIRISFFFFFYKCFFVFLSWCCYMRAFCRIFHPRNEIVREKIVFADHLNC